MSQVYEVGNAPNTMAFICKHILDAIEEKRSLPVLALRDEEDYINAMCVECLAHMNANAQDRVELAIVAEQEIFEFLALAPSLQT